jgi:hypothetical protein
MATQFSPKGSSRPAPVWWRNLERGLLMVLIPATVAIIGTWGFKNELQATRLTLIVNVALVAVIKFIGMMLVDTDDNYVSNLSEADQDKITNVNNPPIEAPKIQ